MTPFPFEALDEGRPRVFVSLGTVSGDRGAAFYETVVAALEQEAIQVVLAAPPELLPRIPQNFIVQRRVPQIALLPKMHAVVCHAGHNTVAEALAHGIPLVVAPIRDDQPVVAQQVVASGAGVRIKYGRASAATLRDAVRRVLTEPSFWQSASRIATSFRDAGGAQTAATLLEQLLPSSRSAAVFEPISEPYPPCPS